MNSLVKAERNALEFIEFCSLTSYHEARASAGMLDIAPELLRIVGAHECMFPGLLWAGTLLPQTPKGGSQEFACHACADGYRDLTVPSWFHGRIIVGRTSLFEPQPSLEDSA
jgi:hypothetical protein